MHVLFQLRYPGRLNVYLELSYFNDKGDDEMNESIFHTNFHLNKNIPIYLT